MILPDGTKPDRDRPAKSRGLFFAVAGMLIVAGFVALGSLGPSDPADEAVVYKDRETGPVVGDDSRVIVNQVASGRLLAVAIEPHLDPTQNVPLALFEIWSVPLP